MPTVIGNDSHNLSGSNFVALEDLTVGALGG